MNAELTPNTDRDFPPRLVAKEALRNAGDAPRHIRALLHGGWGALVSEVRPSRDELRDRIEEFTRKLQK